MTGKQCPRCAGTVPAAAQVCMFCGYDPANLPVERSSFDRWGSALIWAVLIVFLVALLVTLLLGIGP